MRLRRGRVAITMPVLPLLRSLPVVSAAVRPDDLPEGVRAFHRDAITLSWEDRLKTRARRRSNRGVEFATALPRGTMLRQDDCLVLPTLNVVVRVVELSEAVLVVHPATPTLWALYAYQIGNSHQPIMLTDDALICPDILGMEQVLTYHGIPFDREERPFTPVSQVPSHGHVLS
jgi:urease accessory protein UreE